MDSSAPRTSAEARRARILGGLAAAASLVTAAVAVPGTAHELDARLPGPVTMDFVPPPPGSYPLHAIMRAPDGPVLDLDGRRLRLSRFTAGKITLLGFIYTSCADSRGCPLAYQVFHTVRHRVAEDPELRHRVRLVSLSFDPVRDTPAVMRQYAAEAPRNGVEWAFLTTELPRTLVPLLDGFRQDVRLDRDARAEFTEAHIPGAVFFDIDAIADRGSPLPHMLPRAPEFAREVGSLGIGARDRVIVYDSRGVVSAARVWWTFRAFGHDAVAVLDGGFPRWRAEGRPIESGTPAPTPRRFVARLRRRLVRDPASLRLDLTPRRAQGVRARSPRRLPRTQPQPRPSLRPRPIPR